MKKHKVTRATRQKMSESAKHAWRLRDRDMPKEQKSKISKNLKLAWEKGVFDDRQNTPHSEDGKRNISDGLKKAWAKREKRVLPEEWKKKISEGVRSFRKNHPNFQKGENHPCYGRRWNHTEETIEKIRQARLKQVFPIKDTSIEVALQNGLEERNIPFETHIAIPLAHSQPDIFISPNICVFADGDYWHNRPNQIERDQQQNQDLKKLGHQVLRFWEHQINENLNRCLDEIEKIYFTV